jgi:hypothetical protein
MMNIQDALQLHSLEFVHLEELEASRLWLPSWIKVVRQSS